MSSVGTTLCWTPAAAPGQALWALCSHPHPNFQPFSKTLLVSVRAAPPPLQQDCIIQGNLVNRIILLGFDSKLFMNSLQFR